MTDEHTRRRGRTTPTDGLPRDDRRTTDELLPQLVAHLREHRTRLRQEWAGRIHDAHLLQAMTAAGDGRGDDVGLRQLRRGAGDRQRRGAAALRPRPVRADHPARRRDPRGRRHRPAAARRPGPVAVREVPAATSPLLNRVLDAYEPAANRIANTVAVSFVDERERVIRQQQDSIRELSTPVLQVRERLLILPIIGVLDQPAGPAADRAAAQRHPHAPGQGRGHRHHRRAGRRRGGGQPPGADRRRVPADGCQRDHHRAVAGDRPDAGDHRGGPQQDGHRSATCRAASRRPSGCSATTVTRHRGGPVST